MPAMVYIMNEGSPLSTPGEYYLQTIIGGYKAAGFDKQFLIDALRDSCEEEAE
jgi:hypothetical protein